ncbi:inositol monophosphatase family protein [Streptococcus porcinus str. Jelinkova 176]|uniref:Inositol monophosphatase family protein n=1 Tax=Streptococcus porcinus str. Jelinkova 176 TaxID=873448 RepID=A0ABN0CW74_STRPO|nr:inositol monophosphatase family protein [Streptococcus porcinus str. Jelinkova 176]
MRRGIFHLEDKYSFAKKIIKEAADFIKNKMSESLAIQVKSKHDDLVTNVDQETQDFLISNILKYYPNDYILAEEDEVRHPISDGNVWVIDPIDGTVNFVVQRNHFAIMIAYYEDGVGCFGLIYDVMNDLLLSGGGAFDVYLNDQKIEPYCHKPLDRSLIGCNAGLYLNNDYGVANLISHSLGVRIYGGAGISMLKVITQELIAYISYIQPWDYAAALVIGQKLGYKIQTFERESPDFQTRQKLMFFPEAEWKHFESYLDI